MWNDLADIVFYPGDVFIGQLDAGAAGGFHVDNELAGIGARKEGDAEKWRQRQAEHESAHDDCDRHLRVRERVLERTRRTCAARNRSRD